MAMPAHLFVSNDGNLYDTRKKPDWSASPLREGFSNTHREVTEGKHVTSTLRAGRYCFPGGYEIYAITSDGGALCFECVKFHLHSVIGAVRGGLKDGWQVVAFTIAEEPEQCDHCNAEIGGE